jgi:phosphohistidine phosphatase SixA
MMALSIPGRGRAAERRRRLAAAIVLLLGLAAAFTAAAAESDAAWAALRGGGHVALLRHAMTTGGAGDPPGFRLEDCATQRNLSDEGRVQAAALGEAFRAQGVRVDQVWSSPWCRCRDTATLMAVGTVETLPALANLFGRGENKAEQTRILRDTVKGWTGPGTLLLVSHGSTISALTGVSPREGEAVVVAPRPETDDGFAIVGRIGS